MTEPNENPTIAESIHNERTEVLSLIKAKQFIEASSKLGELTLVVKVQLAVKSAEEDFKRLQILEKEILEMSAFVKDELSTNKISSRIEKAEVTEVLKELGWKPKKSGGFLNKIRDKFNGDSNKNEGGGQ